METRKVRTTRLIGTVLACAMLFSLPAHAQSEAEKALLAKARALDARGRADLAVQNWQQVLLSDPNNAEALAGIARADMVLGKGSEARAYLDRLRAANPNDPRIAEIEATQRQRAAAPQLQNAGKLAESGQYKKAMDLYRQTYGNNPPAGDAALGYYETEAATPEGREHAIAGLRDLTKKNPSDPRYGVALGRILTYQPRTRHEGIEILQRYPNDPAAVEALRQALTWDSSNPASADAIRAFLRQHPDKDLEARLAELHTRRGGGVAGVNAYARTSPERAAYAALSANKLDVAEQRFNALKDKDPNNPRVLAGLGFLRMKQNNFGAAISFLEQAKANGLKGPALDNALDTSRFWFVMSEATAALNQNQLDVAIAQFRKAIDMRPGNPEALRGLGGTLLRAQQPAEAAQVYAHLVKIAPSQPEGWRGLFTAQYLMGNPQAALETVARLPQPVRTALASDPEYLTNLAAAYAAVGDESDSQRVLAQAMELPFPNNGVGMKPDRQLQYADLLMAAGKTAQASALYSQVIASDPNNAKAYEGLLRAQHVSGNDAAALMTLEQMPPPILAISERDPAFLATIAAIYQSQGKLDLAQRAMEQAVAASQAGGQPPSTSALLQLAGIYAQQGNSSAAFGIYQQVLSQNPSMMDAWKGLLGALHESHRDTDALAELNQIPPGVRATLNQDPQFLQILASIYNDLNNPTAALATIRQAAIHYQNNRTQPPVSFVIQYCYLLLNAGDDQGLYLQLMQLGGRGDLTPDQRMQAQTVWAVWSVRRAAAASKRGNYHRALQILDAANRAFPDNPDVQKALAGGYQQAGEPKRAEAVYLQMKWDNASAADYRAAIGSALASRDWKQAETWLESALKEYPNDPSILQEAAEYEQAKGDTIKAAEYYKASLDALGPENPAQALVKDLPQTPAANTSAMPSQELVNALAPGADLNSGPPVPLYSMTPPATPSMYLPGQPPVPVQINPGGSQAAPMPGSQPNYSQPGPRMQRQPMRDDVPQQQQPNTERLGDYNPPQSSLSPADICALNRMAGVACNMEMPDNSGWTVKNAAWQATGAQNAVPQPVQVAQASQNSQPAPRMHLRMPAAASVTSTAVNATQPAATANTKIQPVQYQPLLPVYAAPAQSAQSAAQSAAPQTPQAAPAQPPMVPTPAPTMPPAPAQTAPPAQTPPMQMAQPQAAPYQAAPPVPPVQTQTPSGYQQPYNAGVGAQYSTSGPVSGQLGYGTYSQPAGQPYNPNYGPGYSAYSDTQSPVEQQPYYARRLPPLTGSYQQTMPNGGLQTQRDQIQAQLEALQGGYSPWIGATGLISYRSGIPGFDRFTVLQSPLEASAVFSNAIRATVILRPTLIDSGSPAATTTYTFGTAPTGCGSSPACSLFSQTASGLGGEVQIRSTNYGISAGSTPYGFDVVNVIGSIYARPAGGPFTLTFTRDSITDTQLSYSGLHNVFTNGGVTNNGPIWGGVIANAGEGQFAQATDHSGYYIQGGGQYITGKNVEDNYRVDGDAGAYWRIATLPDSGTFTLGANFFAMHYNHNLRYFTFGQGGYFSPDAYLLANVPVTFNGHYGRNLHYRINGSLGVQGFQEDASPFFPLITPASACTSASTNCYPTRDSISGNYLIDAEVAYRLSEHWYAGAFFNANNTRDYNSVTGGFYVRYLFRPQFPTEEGPPTGLFPVSGFRPIQVP